MYRNLILLVLFLLLANLRIASLLYNRFVGCVKHGPIRSAFLVCVRSFELHSVDLHNIFAVLLDLLSFRLCLCLMRGDFDFQILWFRSSLTFIEFVVQLFYLLGNDVLTF